MCFAAVHLMATIKSEAVLRSAARVWQPDIYQQDGTNRAVASYGGFLGVVHWKRGEQDWGRGERVRSEKSRVGRSYCTRGSLRCCCCWAASR